MSDTKHVSFPSCNPVLAASGSGLAFFILACDQLSKWWVREVVLKDAPQMEILPFFNLVSVWNNGISFGMFRAGDPVSVTLLAVLALIITGFFVVLLCQSNRLWTALACGSVIGGSIGNVIDRFQFGAVYDFLDVILIKYHWPAFNIADAAIVIGICMIMFDYLVLSADKNISSKQMPEAENE